MTAALRNLPPEPQLPDAEFEIEDYLDGIAAFLGGMANVIMQLSMRPVGYGVVESPVDSGKVVLHPAKRLRTTLTYLAVALAGSEQERQLYRDAVNRSHRNIRSTSASPVKYNAFDPNLQLWVAACLYWGITDMYERMHGPLDEQVADALYQHAARLGTTLQMRPEMWPADRAAFAAYFESTLAQTRIDPVVREYLYRIVDLTMFPRFMQVLFARPHRYFVSGILPKHVRSEMGLTWTERDDRRFNRLLRATGTVYARLPRPIRMFPMNAYLLDMRTRTRLGKPLV